MKVHFLAAVSLGATSLAAATGAIPESSGPPAAALPSPTVEQRSSFRDRLRNATTVKVKMDILGLEIDSSLEQAHEKLDPIAIGKASPPKKDEDPGEGEGEQKAFWELKKTDFKSVFFKADAEGRVTYMLVTYRGGKEPAFSQIGQVEKAPVQSRDLIAWDVVRKGRPLIRVVARGHDSRAESITIFLVKRPPKR